MQVGIVVGLGLGIGITFLSGCAPGANVPPAAAPIPLVPQAYTALSAPLASTAPPAAQAPLLPPLAAAPAVAGRGIPSPVVKSNQYHPYWVVDVH
jgi:hypothetical protein